MTRIHKPTVKWIQGNILHVETPLGIVNIHLGLTDDEGRRVEAVSMIPNNYAGEPQVYVKGSRFIEEPEKPLHVAPGRPISPGSKGRGGP